MRLADLLDPDDALDALVDLLEDAAAGDDEDDLVDRAAVRIAALVDLGVLLSAIGGAAGAPVAAAAGAAGAAAERAHLDERAFEGLARWLARLLLPVARRESKATPERRQARKARRTARRAEGGLIARLGLRRSP